MLAVTLAALATLGPAGALRVDGRVETSQSARSTTLAEADRSVRAELAVSPHLTLSSDGRLGLLLAYSPVFLAPADLAKEAGSLSAQLAENGTVLHRATAAGGLALSSCRFESRFAAGIGEMLLGEEPLSLLRQSTLETSGGSPLPISTTARLPYLGLDWTNGARCEPSRRTYFAVTGSLTRSGGRGDAARDHLPGLREARATVEIGRHLTRRHLVGLEVYGTRARVGEELDGDAGYLRGGAVWTHEPNPRTGLRASAGLALAYRRADPDVTPVAGEDPPVVPWAEGVLSYTPAGTRPSARLALAFEPVVDRYRGTLDLRSLAAAGVGWAPFHRWSFALHASNASLQTWNGDDLFSPGHTSVRAAGLSADHELWQDVRLTASVGSTWQVTERDDLPEYREDLAMLQLSARILSL